MEMTVRQSRFLGEDWAKGLFKDGFSSAMIRPLKTNIDEDSDGRVPFHPVA